MNDIQHLPTALKEFAYRQRLDRARQDTKKQYAAALLNAYQGGRWRRFASSQQLEALDALLNQTTTMDRLVSVHRQRNPGADIPAMPTPKVMRMELIRCALSPYYFINRYCQIYDAEASNWIPFHLWRIQRILLRALNEHQMNIGLKARQNGFTWLGLAYDLHGMIFRPVWVGLIWSKSDEDAKYLLSDKRLRGMYNHLPFWMRLLFPSTTDNVHEFALGNGSVTYSFPTTRGDGYTAKFAMIDEADLISDLNTLMNRVEPTINAGGKMFMLSRVDKTQPKTLFKQIYRAARQGGNKWQAHFSGWRDNPNRTRQWHDEQLANAMANEGSHDSVWEQYPETDEQALAGKTLNKRFPPAHLLRVFDVQPALDLDQLPGAPVINDLCVFVLPVPGRKYVAGADPAEGNPTSDDSSLDIMDYETGEQVAQLSGKFDPSVLASHIQTLCVWYNNAPVLVERNNHGHAVLLWLRDNAKGIALLQYTDKKPGWHSTSVGKAVLYDKLAEEVKERGVTIHHQKTYDQLSSIEGATLRAPKDEPDDAADSFALASVGRIQAYKTSFKVAFIDS